MLMRRTSRVVVVEGNENAFVFTFVPESPRCLKPKRKAWRVKERAAILRAVAHSVRV
jgi:hypothetical protein